MQLTNIVILDAKRTPMGALNGQFIDTHAANLGAEVIRSLITQSDIQSDRIQQVILGNVLSAGVGQAPARQAALHAGLSPATQCVTLNKVCGSGMQAMRFAYQQLLLGEITCAIAGGMENMSRAPYMLEKARSGYRLGHGQLLDHMYTDGLEDAYSGNLMGTYAEATAQKYQFSREAQDSFALASLNRYQQASNAGMLAQEITPVTVKTRKDILTLTQDEPPQKARPEKIPALKSAFAKDGTVTAANSSSIADGAAAVLMTTADYAKQNNLTPRAVIKGFHSYSQAPEWFTTAPVGAITGLLDKVNLRVEDVDLFEINEAFAVVTMAAMHDLNIPHEKVNIFGGACALGHPLGASGARIVVTLLNALEQKDLKRGIAALCIGGGEGIAILIERA